MLRLIRSLLEKFRAKRINDPEFGILTQEFGSVLSKTQHGVAIAGKRSYWHGYIWFEESRSQIGIIFITASDTGPTNEQRRLLSEVKSRWQSIHASALQGAIPIVAEWANHDSPKADTDSPLLDLTGIEIEESADVFLLFYAAEPLDESGHELRARFESGELVSVDVC